MADRALTVTFIGNDAQLSAALKRVGTQLTGLQRTGQQMQSVGSSLTRNLTLPIVGIGIAAAKMASDFQSSMAKLQTQAGASAKQVAALSKGVLGLSGQVGEAPEELSAALFHVTSALNSTLAPTQRVSTELRVLKIAAEGARVGGANLVDVTNALDSAVVSGIKGVQNYQQAMGALNAIVGAGDQTMQDLADALGTGLLAPMKTYGLTLKDVGGALATFGDNNVRGQEAATKLISAVRIMAAPSKAAADALSGINLSTLTLANDMRKGGLIQALEDLRTHLQASGDTASQQGLVIARAFGGRQSTGVQLLLNQLDRLKAKTEDVGTGAQSFGKSWAVTQQTAAQKTADALAKMKADLTSFGGDVLPELLSIGSTIVNDVDKVAKDFESLPKSLQDTIIKGGLVLATVGPAMKILGLFTSSIGKLSALAAGKGLSGALGGGTAVRAGTAAAAAEGGAAVSVSSVLGRVLGVAGFALLAAPLAPALASVVTNWIHRDADKEGQAFADKFTAPLGPAVAKKFNSSIAAAQTKITTTQQTQQLRRNIAASPGLARGGPGGAGLPTPSNAALEKQFHDEGVKLGQATVAGLKSVKDPSSSILLSDFLLQLRKLPSQAQPEAAKTMLDFAIGLEQSGKIPYKSLQGIIKGLEGQIPGFSSYLDNQGSVINQVFSKTLTLSPATTTLKNALAGFRQQFGDWAISTKVTGDNIDTNISRAMTDLHQVVATSSGSTRKDAVAELTKLHDQTIALFNSMGDKVQTSVKSMSTAIKGGSASAAKVASENLGDFAANVEKAMSASVLSEGQGMKLIVDNTNKALKEMGQKELSPIQVGSLTLGIGKQQQLAASGAARGGLFQIGRAGEAGRDTVPMSVGGNNIVVAPGEIAAIFNRHQAPIVDQALAMQGYGGLSGLFSKVNKPNYMAGGGVVSGHIPTPTVTGSGAIETVVHAAIQKVAAAANSLIKAKTPAANPAGGSTNIPGLAGITGGGSVSANVALGHKMMLAAGWPESQWPSLYQLWTHESGWSTTAGSPSQAYGIPQSDPGTKMASSGPDWLTDAATQIRWGLGYIRGRYVNPSVAWAGWYGQNFAGTPYAGSYGYGKGGLPFAGSFDKGGTVPGKIGMPSLAVVHGGEHVLPAFSGGGTVSKKAASTLGAKITFSGTENLVGGLGSIPSQGIGAQIQLAQLSNAVTTAQNTGNTNAQKAALQKEMKYEKSWLSADQKQLKKVNSLLKKKGLTRKQRGQLLQDKLGLIQEIGAIEGDMGGISSSLSDLATSSTDTTDTSGTDTSSTDTSSTDDATQALADAIQAQTDAINQLQQTLQEEKSFMSGVMSVETGQAIKALSDVISGQIGGRYLSRATGSAGDGSVARY